MLFLLDANIPYSAKDLFPKDYQIVHVRDISLSTASDNEIILWAKKHKATLVTRDFDFANIINFPPADYFGIIVLKMPSFYTAEQIKKILTNFLANIKKELIPQSTIIAEETRFRIRK